MTSNKKNKSMQVINFSEICWRLLQQWKAVVCFALIITALFVGFMQWRYSIQSKAIIEQQKEMQSKASDEIINELPKDKQEEVSNAYNLKRQVQASEDYIRTSSLMKIDPYHARRFKTNWIITESSGQDAALAEAYMLYVDSDVFCQDLLSCFGEDADIEMVREAVVYELVGEETRGAFSCNLYLSEGIDEKAVQKEFPLAMEAAHKKISDEVGKHKLQCLDQAISEGEDQSLIDYQNKAYNRALILTNQLKAKTDAFTSEQKSAYEKLISTEDEKDTTVTANNAISLRNILIGLILGVFLYAGCLVLYVVVSGRVFSRGELEETGIYTLGNWYQDQPKKGLASIFNDRHIYRRHHRNHLVKESEIRHAAKAILDVCRDEKKELLLAMTAPLSAEQESFCNEVMASLAQKGISAVMVVTDNKHSPLDDYAAADVCGVVFVTIDGKTRFKCIDMIMNQCLYHDVPVYGNIYLG